MSANKCSFKKASSTGANALAPAGTFSSLPVSACNVFYPV